MFKKSSKKKKADGATTGVDPHAATFDVEAYKREMIAKYTTANTPTTPAPSSVDPHAATFDVEAYKRQMIAKYEEEQAANVAKFDALLEAVNDEKEAEAEVQKGSRIYRRGSGEHGDGSLSHLDLVDADGDTTVKQTEKPVVPSRDGRPAPPARSPLAPAIPSRGTQPVMLRDRTMTRDQLPTTNAAKRPMSCRLPSRNINFPMKPFAMPGLGPPGGGGGGGSPLPAHIAKALRGPAPEAEPAADPSLGMSAKERVRARALKMNKAREAQT